MPSTRKRPRVSVPDLWSDGNIFFIVAKARKAMRRADWPDEAIKEFTAKVNASESYDEALHVVMEYADEEDSDD